MAKREKRTTSLGNAVDSHDKILGARGHGTTERWRSLSDTSHQQSRQKKLFGSLREAMEHDAAEQKAREAVGVNSTSAVLDARALSSLEKTQADEAGYTVIRRRVVSDLSEHRSRSDRHMVQGQDSGARGRQSARGRSGGGGGEGGRGGGGNHSKIINADTSGRGVKVKRSQYQQQLQPKQPKAREDPWKLAVVGHLPRAKVALHHGVHVAASPAACSLDAQRWLEAASSGAVLPVASLPPGSPPPSADSTRAADWNASPSPMWPAEMSNPTTEDLKEAVSSQQPTEEVAACGTPSAASEKLHESMLSWLESTLSLDETRSSPPHPPP